MPIDKETMRQVGHALRPIATRIANSIARGVIQLVNDDKRMQLVQLGVLEGEDVEGGSGGAEHFQPYGFASVPFAGAEAVVIFPNGDRSHPLVISVADRRYRPVARDPGTVTLHNHNGAAVTIKPNGDVVVQAVAGRKVFIQDEDGGTQPLATLADIQSLSDFVTSLHMPVIGGGGGTAGPPSGTVPTPLGTSVLEAQ